MGLGNFGLGILIRFSLLWCETEISVFAVSTGIYFSTQFRCFFVTKKVYFVIFASFAFTTNSRPRYRESVAGKTEKSARLHCLLPSSDSIRTIVKKKNTRFSRVSVSSVQRSNSECFKMPSLQVHSVLNRTKQIVHYFSQRRKLLLQRNKKKKFLALSFVNLNTRVSICFLFYYHYDSRSIARNKRTSLLKD